jgi:hypothetical protein
MHLIACGILKGYAVTVGLYATSQTSDKWDFRRVFDIAMSLHCMSSGYYMLGGQIIVKTTETCIRQESLLFHFTNP